MLYVKYGKNRLMASEEMLFENVDRRRTPTDDGQTTDAYLYYKLTYEPSAQGSGELKRPKYLQQCFFYWLT